MKMKKWFGLLFLGLVLTTLAACGQKTPEEIIKTELKDSYTGYSEDPGSDYPFNDGDDILTFNKKDNSITNSQGQMTYFSVVPKEEVPAGTQRVIDELETKLKGTNNFTIIINSTVKNPTKKDSEGAYQIALSDGGKAIRIFELGREPRSFGYYDFSGKAK
ncbi:hypothetical protein [Streptococcus equi]|uniref:hypothetical protein n=1 Tax=Streptococcus equi TaxID=1336 RepID=UPI001E57D0C6|nr:hypothetical protein [Streptococcus equi]MCD3445408.1 hypothetical protein [Streptococcus equi subsp. zooepidemicus]